MFDDLFDPKARYAKALDVYLDRMLKVISASKGIQELKVKDPDIEKTMMVLMKQFADLTSSELVRAANELNKAKEEDDK